MTKYIGLMMSAILVATSPYAFGMTSEGIMDTIGSMPIATSAVELDRLANQLNPSEVEAAMQELTPSQIMKIEAAVRAVRASQGQATVGDFLVATQAGQRVAGYPLVIAAAVIVGLAIFVSVKCINKNSSIDPNKIIRCMNDKLK